MVAFCSGSPSRPRHEGNSHFLPLGLGHSYVKVGWLELLQLASVYEQKSLRAKADRLRTSVGEKEFGSLMIALNSYINQTCLSHLPSLSLSWILTCAYSNRQSSTGGDRDVSIYGWVWEHKNHRSHLYTQEHLVRNCQKNSFHHWKTPQYLTHIFHGIRVLFCAPLFLNRL